MHTNGNKLTMSMRENQGECIEAGKAAPEHHNLKIATESILTWATKRERSDSAIGVLENEPYKWYLHRG